MAKLAELRSLVNLAQRLGQEPSAALLEHVARLEREEQQRQQREASIKQRIAQDLEELFTVRESTHELVQENTAPPSTPEDTTTPYQSHDRETAAGSSRELTEDSATPPAAESMADRVARVISETGVVAPDPVLAQPQKDLEREIRYLREWVGKIAATGPGSGEVNLRYLDDVNRSTIEDHRYLRYDAATKKFVFDTGHFYNYHLQAQSQTTQTSSATSANSLIFEVTDISYGITVDGGNSSQIVLAHPGTYNLQFSVQLYNVGNSEDSVNIWFALNGQNIAGSNSIVTVPKKSDANAAGAVIAGWNYMFTTTMPNEYIEIKWFVADETHTFIAAVSSQAATASSPFMPAVPSVIVTITPVSTVTI
jgi:hypothetical protein